MCIEPWCRQIQGEKSSECQAKQPPAAGLLQQRFSLGEQSLLSTFFFSIYQHTLTKTPGTLIDYRLLPSYTRWLSPTAVSLCTEGNGGFLWDGAIWIIYQRGFNWKNKSHPTTWSNKSPFSCTLKWFIEDVYEPAVLQRDVWFCSRRCLKFISEGVMQTYMSGCHEVHHMV